MSQCIPNTAIIKINKSKKTSSLISQFFLCVILEILTQLEMALEQTG
jgi:hypothetical protein